MHFLKLGFSRSPSNSTLTTRTQCFRPATLMLLLTLALVCSAESANAGVLLVSRYFSCNSIISVGYATDICDFTLGRSPDGTTSSEYQMTRSVSPSDTGTTLVYDSATPNFDNFVSFLNDASQDWEQGYATSFHLLRRPGGGSGSGFFKNSFGGANGAKRLSHWQIERAEIFIEEFSVSPLNLAPSSTTFLARFSLFGTFDTGFPPVGEIPQYPEPSTIGLLVGAAAFISIANRFRRSIPSGADGRNR